MRISSYIASATSIPGAVRAAPLHRVFMQSVFSPPHRWVPLTVPPATAVIVVLYQTWFSNLWSIAFGVVTAVALYCLLILLILVWERGK